MEWHSIATLSCGMLSLAVLLIMVLGLFKWKRSLYSEISNKNSQFDSAVVKARTWSRNTLSPLDEIIPKKSVAGTVIPGVMRFVETCDHDQSCMTAAALASGIYPRGGEINEGVESRMETYFPLTWNYFYHAAASNNKLEIGDVHFCMAYECNNQGQVTNAIIVVRGTESWVDMGTNLHLTMASCTSYFEGTSGPGEDIPEMDAHSGFWSAAVMIADAMREQLRQHMFRMDTRIMCCGHSLGGAVASLLACIIAWEHRKEFKHNKSQDINVWCITFGSPRCAMMKICDNYEPLFEEKLNAFMHSKAFNRRLRITRIETQWDPVIHLPIKKIQSYAFRHLTGAALRVEQIGDQTPTKFGVNRQSVHTTLPNQAVWLLRGVQMITSVDQHASNVYFRCWARICGLAESQDQMSVLASPLKDGMLATAVLMRDKFWSQRGGQVDRLSHSKDEGARLVVAPSGASHKGGGTEFTVFV